MPETESAITSHHDVPCPGCGCLCDDLSLVTTDAGISQFEPHCDLAAKYFTSPAASLTDCRIGNQPAELGAAIDAASKLLKDAKSPLLFGLGETTSETVRKVVDLADRIGGRIDATHPTFFDPSGRILQTTGMVTCSLGEIRHRADLVLFWGCDPPATHPRHFQRYSVEPPGRFIEEGRAGRQVVGIGPRIESSGTFDNWIDLKPEQQIAALHALNTWAEQKPQNNSSIESQLKEIAPQLADLHQQVTQAKYFVFVLGEGFLRREAGRVPLELLARYVRTLHEQTRGAISILRPGPNWVGAAGVVASRTGYPGGASLEQGIPQFDPDNSSATKLLETGRADAALVFEGPWWSQMSSEAINQLQSIPRITLSHRAGLPCSDKEVFLPIARPGVTAGGTMSRMDDMPLPLRQLGATDTPSGQEAIEAILGRIQC